MLPEKVKETVRRFGMLDPGDTVLVAVSGGPDSVCLLNVLHGLSTGLQLTLHIGHLDHMFRGKESAAEASFVSDLAAKLGIRATVEQFDVPSFCRERGLSAQAGAREVRYEFLERVADGIGASCIATGHTASDQAETFLMRLVRGAGATGLSAIPPVRGKIIRPLISVTREEVLRYLQSNSLDFVNDPSNEKAVYTRNRIRLDVMPVLKRLNPRIEEILAAEAGLLRDEDEALDSCLEKIARDVLVSEEKTISVKRGEFNGSAPGVRRRILRKALELSGLDMTGLALSRVDEALTFMHTAQTGRTLRIPGGISITREYDRFVLNPNTSEAGFSRPIVLPGTTVIPELALEVETSFGDDADTAAAGGNYLWQTVFDYDKIGTILTMRNRQPGDWFCPAGMGGRSKKLQDYLVDEKIPRRRRNTVPLLCAGENIIWVVGFRTDARFLAGPDTKRPLAVQVKQAGARS